MAKEALLSLFYLLTEPSKILNWKGNVSLSYAKI